jgi:hypothetical protein
MNKGYEGYVKLLIIRELRLDVSPSQQKLYNIPQSPVANPSLHLREPYMAGEVVCAMRSNTVSKVSGRN